MENTFILNSRANEPTVHLVAQNPPYPLSHSPSCIQLVTEAAARARVATKDPAEGVGGERDGVRERASERASEREIVSGVKDVRSNATAHSEGGKRGEMWRDLCEPRD